MEGARRVHQERSRQVRIEEPHEFERARRELERERDLAIKRERRAAKVERRVSEDEWADYKRRDGKRRYR